MTGTPRVPSYRLHKPSGRAIVSIRGRMFYLGPWGTPESKAEYARLIGEYLATEGRPPAPPGRPGSPTPDITVVELIPAYIKHCRAYYARDGKPGREADNIEAAMKLVRKLYGHTQAAHFGPVALKAVRQAMIAEGWSRHYVNVQVGRVRRMFKWAASEEMLPVAVYQALSTVEGLRRGRSAAKERPPVQPVPDDVVEATLPHLSPVVADMVRLQRLTGMRSGELVIMRPGDIDRSDPDCWVYTPPSHKAAHHGRDRPVFLGPRAQTLIAPYIAAAGDGFLFSPRRAEARRNAEKRAARQTPMTPSHAARRKAAQRRRHRSRAPGEHYTPGSYCRAIAYAVDHANAERAKSDLAPLPSWHPHRLRHTVATEVRKRYGLEAAQAVLGHAELSVSQVYAEKDMALARKAMREVG